ncbi:tryptophan synthase subunit beta [Haloarcula pellucida]|uniref:Tryptophan synthase beta chain n=1 Tax=Haloarcula pellucida TaxID=1427151 RepID=A0A830GRZ3_9EURY|nr:tryptophan synthase subunit beta [Halomicroarcula pellucida]MBX0350340.1 tryptophan synthase subunit beta [Halomicroarcula pellucida]GGO01593.1 tryptophan synthase subunit beta [Halomicroarcula pellucida]
MSTPGAFEEFGGRHVPEPLEEPLAELAAAFEEVRDDESFREELDSLLEHFGGRPTPVFHAETLSERYDANIYFKHEDLLHGGAHKLNNTLGQALLAKKAGKERLIAETGAGQHGTATAMVGALLDLDTTVYMGRRDMQRQEMNVFRMRLMGADVEEVTRGNEGLAEAVDAAMEDLVAHTEETHYLVGSAVGPDPFPRMVREFQSVIGREAREQIQELHGDLPDACVACVGGGSNAIGLFHAFKQDDVALYGAEPAGKGLDSGQHSAPLSATKHDDPQIFQGMKTHVIDEDTENHSVSAGLDYPAVGPEHAALQSLGRAEYHGITDEEALAAFRELSEAEGIVPALEPSHAIALAIKLAEEDRHDTILVNLCGRGDKDMQTAAEKFDLS